ncbi:acyltransferase family protein [Aurantiacibacter sp. MUD61]|uniref:acyltransferase family protein n=1 Tax=Aurantiacibacter sp. MUD61 TaxID=3009083 RepID=UPI0022F02BA6|nr:acyltransferase [Aurantiacibacter sp. MUD61]
MKDSGRNKIQTLELGRGVAALGVVVFHAAYAMPADDLAPLLERFFLAGQTGIYFFFVLSGFVMFWVHEKDFGRPEQAPKYILKRINRIYPIYWAILIPMLLAYQILPQLGLPEFREAGTIVSAFLLAGDINPTPLTVAWTLFHEMLFYVIFGVVILSRRWGGALFIIWMVACLANIWMGIEFYPLSPVNILFAFGAAAAWIVRNRSIASRTWLWSGIALFVATVLFTDAFHMGTLGIILVGTASTMIIAGSAALELRGTLELGRPWVTLGAVSYVLYLVHGPVISALAIAAESVAVPLNRFAFIAICIVASLLVSYVVHRLLERPMLKLGGAAIRSWDERRAVSGA